MRPSGARRHGPGADDQLRSRARREGLHQGLRSAEGRLAAGSSQSAVEALEAGGAREPPITTWRHELTGALFPDAYNPFALPSIMGSWGWLDTKVVDMGPYLRRRGLVFVDGKPLEPMEQLRELAMPKLPPVPDFTVPAQPQHGMPPRRRGGPIMQEVGGSPDARFWVEIRDRQFTSAWLRARRPIT